MRDIEQLRAAEDAAWQRSSAAAATARELRAEWRTAADALQLALSDETPKSGDSEPRSCLSRARAGHEPADRHCALRHCVMRVATDITIQGARCPVCRPDTEAGGPS